MAGNILREYLVALGYRVDATSERKFTGSLAATAKAVAKVGIAVEGMAVAIKAAVAVSAASLEQLYYASRRTGASAANIRSLAFAVGQMGGSADEARASLENFGRFLRNNPAAEGFLRSLGVRTRDVNGRLRDTSELMEGLARALRSKPAFVRQQIASIFGVDERTLMALIEGTERFRERYAQMARRIGVDLDEAGRGSMRLMNALRETGHIIDLLWAKVTQEALKNGMAKQFEDFNTFLLNHAPEIVAMVERIVAAVLHIAEELVRFALKLDGVITNTVGWETALKGLAAFLAAGTLLNLLGRLRIAMLGIAALTPPGWLLALAGILYPSSTAQEPNMVGAPLRGGPAPPGGNVNPLRPDGTTAPGQPGWWQRNVTPFLRRHGWQFQGAVPGGAEGDRRHQVGAFLRGMGWSADATAGILANIQTESHFDPNAVGDNGKAFGLGQWRDDRLTALGRFIAQRRGVASADPRSASLLEQAAFYHHELTGGSDMKARRAGQLLREIGSAAEAGNVVSRLMERPHDPDGTNAAARAELASRIREADSVVLNQTTQITVSGAGDPGAVARGVGAEQSRVNADALRTARSAVR